MRVLFPAESSLFLIKFICIQLELLLQAFKTTNTQQPASTTRFLLVQHIIEIRLQTLEVAEGRIIGLKYPDQQRNNCETG